MGQRPDQVCRYSQKGVKLEQLVITVRSTDGKV